MMPGGQAASSLSRPSGITISTGLGSPAREDTCFAEIFRCILAAELLQQRLQESLQRLHVQALAAQRLGDLHEDVAVLLVLDDPRFGACLAAGPGLAVGQGVDRVDVIEEDARDGQVRVAGKRLAEALAVDAGRISRRKLLRPASPASRRTSRLA